MFVNVSLSIFDSGLEDLLILQSIGKALISHCSALREKCPYSEFFWSVFSRIWTEYGDLFRKSLYSVRMPEKTDQKNSEYEHFLRSGDPSS